jgi:hypothetical protein
MSADKNSKPASNPQSKPQPFRDLPQKDTGRKEENVKGGRATTIDGAQPHL